MADPLLVSSRVEISYKADDGYSSTESFRAGPGSFNDDPEGALLAGFEELSRLLHLFGFGEEAMRRASAAAARVQEFFDNRHDAGRS